MRASLIAGVIALAPGLAASAGLGTGAYDEGLLIGYDPADAIVSGYYNASRGEAPGFSCIFYLQGRLAAGSARVVTYFPAEPTSDRIVGTLAATNAKSVRIILPRDHGGCANVRSFADKDAPAEFALDSPRSWIAVRVVRADRAHFYPHADARAPNRAYMVRGDGFGVVARAAGWVEADFEGPDRSTWGWIKETDLFPAP